VALNVVPRRLPRARGVQSSVVPCLVLSFQASYRCRHSGACCKSGWPIPVDLPLASELKRALASGLLRLNPHDERLDQEPLEAPAGLPPEVGGLTRSDASGACAFYERGSGLCAIHRQLGPDRLPSSCAHFPRVCLIDEDAIYVTLSHYCPTVADLLFEAPADDDWPASEPTGDGRLAGAVATVPGLLAGIEVEGLDARGHLPPLLRPGMLADRASYRRWERYVVEELAAGRGRPEARLRRVAAATDAVVAWSPSTSRSLEEHVRRCFEDEGQEGGSRAPAVSLDAIRSRYEAVRACCPSALTAGAPPADLDHLLDRWVDPEWEKWANVMGRYLAAKVFGSWLAYQGRGLKTVLAGAFAALAGVRVEAARQCEADGRRLDAALLKEAIRQADLLLVHLASREVMANKLDHLLTP